MTTESDIIESIAPGTECMVWIDRLNIDRQGSKPVPGGEVSDTWRIGWISKASLVDAGGTLVLVNGQEVPVPSPKPSGEYDVADLLHDPEVQQIMGLLRNVGIRLARGTLKPLITEA